MYMYCHIKMKSQQIYMYNNDVIESISGSCNCMVVIFNVKVVSSWHSPDLRFTLVFSTRCSQMKVPKYSENSPLFLLYAGSA